MNSIYWLPDPASRLAIVRRPRPDALLRADLKHFRQSGIDVVVSLLPAGEAEELGLRFEGDECRQAGIKFANFPITDRGVPSSREFFLRYVHSLRQEISNGRAIGIHCQGCIGRSSLLAASLLCSTTMSPLQAFDFISQYRGCRVPDSPEQLRFVEHIWADLLLP